MAKSKAKEATRTGMTSTILNKIFFERKTLQEVLQEAEHDHEGGAGKLTLIDLLAIGIGATIGSGVFVLTGKAVPIAGGGAIVAWLIAGAICFLSSSSYMELTSRLPTKGSCYVFSYHSLGELASVVGAVCLTMEYGISSAGIARTWSLKFGRAVGIAEHSFICYNGQEFGSESCSGDVDNYFDPIAGVMVLLCTAVVARGLDMGKIIINSFTVAKILLVIFMIIAGFSCWTGNMFASTESFLPEGVAGVFKVTPMLFWGFIGFDEVCCMASKAADPVKTMPYAMGGTLLGAGLISALAQFALSAMVPVYAGMGSVPFEQAFEDRGLHWVKWIISVGELTLLPLVCLLSLLPQPEVTAAMSEDRLIPSVFRKRNRQGTFVKGSIIVGIVASVLAMTVPFALLGDVISFGVLFSFNLTNLSLINLRYGNGGARREPTVDILGWILMVALAVAGYCCQQGLVERALAGMSISLPALAGFIASSIIALGILSLLAFGFEQKCDMADANIYKARGVPFLPGFAIFCNWFLIASFSWTNVGYFVAFLGLFLVTYIFNLLRSAGTWSSPVTSDSDQNSTVSASEVSCDSEIGMSTK
mmetsp:Transcript_86491/g.189889  ORF Transcript_86491/g.189889 Transcript_86491/m.189889 type:complete len:590 (+) Transcript_86491:127-1896(+)